MGRQQAVGLMEVGLAALVDRVAAKGSKLNLMGIIGVIRVTAVPTIGDWHEAHGPRPVGGSLLCAGGRAGHRQSHEHRAEVRIRAWLT